MHPTGSAEHSLLRGLATARRAARTTTTLRLRAALLGLATSHCTTVRHVLKRELRKALYYTVEKNLAVK